ncbi:hypothetical protein [Pseudomonas soli]|uniref:Uncharacterized protein n=1 Tax=Pseudomonas soli TaxID=1306993 RepID=A0AAJ5MJR4_9PSED|nr:hypothetical protein [Pseudomonas soli]UXZ44532.1 hypothetical protein K7K07_21030 [Pseudomonas soli]
MSNTEMVSVPRGLAERIAQICMFTMYKEDYRAISEILSQPADQHHDEPVAWLRRCLKGERAGCIEQGGPGEANNPEYWSPAFPVYERPDPGEVERLREGISKHWKVVCDQRAELDTLRAHLAERDALLSEIRGDITSRGWNGGCSIPSRIDLALLSASAEPSAPVERDERAEFEACIRREWPMAPISRKRDLLPKGDPCYGDYCDEPLQRAWVGWQMRAALERKSPTAPDDDQPCDLATWKRRAIEAESKLRTYDPQVVELGERAMQAILVDPKPAQLVLTKCRLCDQLQSDLTARDERIDKLEQALRSSPCVGAGAQILAHMESRGERS